MKKYMINPFSLFFIGGVLGVMSKLLDIYTTNLGHIFSQMAIWILLGVLISIYSDTKKKAMLNIFPFCIGMLITYYLTAEIKNAVYGWDFIIGWTIFALFSPIFAYFTWLTKEKGIFPRIISVGIVLTSILSSALFFGDFRIYDFIINGLLIYFLFMRKVRR